MAARMNTDIAGETPRRSRTRERRTSRASWQSRDRQNRVVPSTFARPMSDGGRRGGARGGGGRTAVGACRAPGRAFLRGVVGGLVGLSRGGRAAAVWLGTTAGLLVLLVGAHEPIRRRAERARRAVDFYARGIARVEGRWAGTGVGG